MRTELILGVALSTPCGCAFVIGSPTGCIFASGGLAAYAIDDNQILECLWCGATFYRIDFQHWLRDEYTNTPHAPRTLFRIGEDAMEIMRFCDCGTPFVRKIGHEGVFHFEASTSSITWMLN